MPVSLKKSQYTKPKAWKTTRIKTSRANKRKLHLMCRDGNYHKLKEHYKQHCKTLMQVIIVAKKLYFNNLLFTSKNKQTTAWSIIKTVMTNKINANNASVMNINDNLSNNHLTVANTLNKNFLSVTNNISINNYMNQVNLVSNSNNPLHYVHHAFKEPFLNIKFKYTTTKEIEVVIKSLKTKNSRGYDQISTKILKISTQFTY